MTVRLSRDSIRAIYGRRKPSVTDAIWRRISLAFVRWALDSEERWVRDCRRDGVLESRHMKYIRQQAQTLRVKARMLEIDR